LQRGGVLIEKWGRSSAASTAVSIADAIRSLVTPTPEGDWFSSGVIISLLFNVHAYKYMLLYAVSLLRTKSEISEQPAILPEIQQLHHANVGVKTSA
jgi:hypothetical protein